MSGDHREQAELDAEDLGEGVAQRQSRDDPGQGDRDDHEKGDRLAAEEAVAGHRERRERAKTKATGVATSPTSTEVRSAWRAPGLWIA